MKLRRVDGQGRELRTEARTSSLLHRVWRGLRNISLRDALRGPFPWSREKLPLMEPREEGREPDIPGLDEETQGRVIAEAALRKWSGVQFYGEGAEAAYKRREERMRALGLIPPQEETPGKRGLSHGEPKKPLQALRDKLRRLKEKR